MTRKKWFVTALVALPLAIAGVVYGVNIQRPSTTEPVSIEEKSPSCCPFSAQSCAEPCNDCSSTSAASSCAD
jgi:hypothetical protein